METSEVERELEELESRLERLRALYEQHFIGLEKLEPLIPRKDVDRRIWVLRREQIRNTGLRFKFQMLIQRYNTFQQYWGRILREIDSGTYRRDVVRAAKRFGAAEALTILGKRRAKKYADLALVQEAKRGPPPREAIVEELPDEYLEEEPASEELHLSDDDIEDQIDVADEMEDDSLDEAPTPVPSKRTVDLKDPLLWPTPLPPRAEPPSPVAPASSSPRATTQVDKSPANIPAPRPTDPEAAKRRVAELAAQARASRPGAPVMSTPAGPLELDLDFDSPKPAPKAPAPRRPSTTKMTAVKPPSPGATAAPKAPGVGTSGRKPSQRNIRVRAFIAASPPRVAAGPRPVAMPAPEREAKAGFTELPLPNAPAPTAASAPSTDAAHVPAEPRTSVEPQDRPPERAKPGVAQQAALERVDRGLEEARLKQIYAKYIEARRAANEPTAGITFEKLAESLRVQAAKLRESHAARSIDYDVVVKNGKTLIKPILK